MQPIRPKQFSSSTSKSGGDDVRNPLARAVNHSLAEKIRLRRFKSNAALRAEFYQAMADTASQGLPQVDVLRTLKNNLSTKDPLYTLIDVVEGRIKGISESKSLKGHRSLGSELSGLLPDIEVSMIAAGESSGAIEKGWRNAAQFAMGQDRQRKALIKAMIKPTGYLFALLGLLLFFSLKLLPDFESFKPRDTWPELAKNVGWIADHVMWIVGLMALLFIGLTIAYRWLSINWTGAARHAADFKFPFSFAAQSSGTGFMMAVASFMGAGIPFTESLKTIKQTGNRYLSWQIECIEDDLRSGMRPEQSLIKRSCIPKSVHWRVVLYAMSSSGSLASAYERIAQDMANKTETSQSLAAELVNLIMFATIAVMIVMIFGTLAGIATTGLDL